LCKEGADICNIFTCNYATNCLITFVTYETAITFLATWSHIRNCSQIGGDFVTCLTIWENHLVFQTWGRYSYFR